MRGKGGTGGVLFVDHLPVGSGELSFGDLGSRIVEDHHGSLLERNELATGLEFVAVFDAVADAVCAAIALHREALAVEPSCQPRCGVSFGEYEGNDRGGYGSVIIEAVRLQHRAQGKIALSDAAKAQLPGEFHDHLTDEGWWELKGFDEPVAVHSLAGVPTADLRGLGHPASVVMSVDIVGSTELLGRLGRDGAIALHHDFFSLLAEAGLSHEGDGETSDPPSGDGAGPVVVLDRRGDGAIFNVATASGAIQRGLRFQAALKRYGWRSDAVAPFAVRIGIVAGSRPIAELEAEAVALESASSPGEVWVDDTVVYLARDLMHVDFAALENESSTNSGSWFRAVPHRDDSVLGLPAPLEARRAIPLVGRDREVAELTDRWQRTRSGVASFAAVVGESGIGKTRLVAEFAARAAEQGAHVLFGWNEDEWQEPFGPFFEALNDSEGDGSELRRFAAAMASDSGGGDRSAFFRKVGDQLRALELVRPVVLVLDDLHWATPATLSLLRHVMRDLADERLFVVATYRPIEAEANDAVQEFEAELRRGSASLARVDVAGVSLAAVTSMLSEYLGADSHAPASSDLARRIHAETGGSPFFARELLTHMASGGTLSTLGSAAGPVDLAQLPVPDSLRDVVRQRVEDVDTDALTVLTHAAVVGERFSIEVLAELLGTRIDNVLDVVERAEQAALVVEADRSREYRFAHAIVRSTLLDGLSSTRRSLVHERLGLVFEDLPGDHLDELTYHWQQAGGSRGPLKSAEYLRLAAARDAAALDWESAASRYRILLEMLAETAGHSELLIESWLGLGHVLRSLGDPDYIDAMKTAGRLARSIGDHDLLARAAIGSMKPGSWFANANETDELIIGFCEEAAQGLNPLDPQRVRLLAILATSLAFEDGRDRREAYAREAVSLSRSMGDSALLASALVAEHLALWDPSTFVRRGEIATELARLATRLDDHEVAFLAGFFRTSWLLEQGLVAQARDGLATLEAPIDKTGNFWFRFLVDRMHLGIDIAAGQGDNDTLKQAVDALFESAASTQADAPGTWAAQLGGVAINEERFGTMAESLKGAAERSQGQGIWSYAYVLALLEGDEVDLARTAAHGLKEPNLDFMWLVSMQFLADIGYRLSDVEISTRAFEALLPYRDRLGVVASGTLTYDFVATSLGAAALGMGKPDLAVPFLQQAIDHARREGLCHPERRSANLLSEATAPSM